MSGRRRRPRVLILGGTTEARELAGLAAERWGSRIDLVTSLAGRTAAPARVAGRVRRGGFGGAAGLAEFLRREKIDYLIDATHPFAARISRHAADAAAAADVARLTLTRPPWRPGSGDRWIEVDDAAAAAAQLPALGRRVWLTVGSGDFAAFAGLKGIWFLVRRIDPPAAPLPLRDHTLILGRGPFVVAAERALLAEHRIEVLVCRASGGAATGAKLEAARTARLPVVMIRRPAATAGPAVGSPRAALAWLTRRITA
ncbi:MAG TPA: cobalt-precorrin-6A reductase [Alphaproteobacteria bacterium]|nr:cobalt-precorrin-6A reductase [Alphaproteobacteria bacterium]